MKKREIEEIRMGTGREECWRFAVVVLSASRERDKKGERRDKQDERKRRM